MQLWVRVQKRKVRLAASRVLGCMLLLVCGVTGIQSARSQPMTIDVQRRRLELQQRIVPAGIGLPRRSINTTLHRLDHLPRLRDAVLLSALEEPGSAPFHLSGTLQWTSDTGKQNSATLEEDWYTDRWSRISLTVNGMRSRRFVLNGDRRVDDELPVVPFTLRRLLAALYDPLGDVEQVKAKTTTETVTIDGHPVLCTSLPAQPPLTNGLVRLPRSVCLDGTTGDLRVEANGYGVQTLWNEVRPLGSRRVATSISILRNGQSVGTLRLDELRVAGELSPESFAHDLATAAKLPTTEPQERLMATPVEMRGDLASIDARLIPLTEDALKRHEPMAVVRVLVGPDGRLADLEILSQSSDGLRQRTISILSKAYFRERTWNGKAISTEGLLIMGLP